MSHTLLERAKELAIGRPKIKISLPKYENGAPLPVSAFFGENLFDFRKSSVIPEDVRESLLATLDSDRQLPAEHAEIVAKAVTKWAVSKGATHFCHWFQPLTGGTAEKHDAFLSFDSTGIPIEKLSSQQLLTGEPDASSFPHGGVRSTFEARGYTTWDMSSPMFLAEGTNGKVLCIPTAFVSHSGDALDIKTPLLRSISRLNEAATEFMHLTGDKEVQSVMVTCGLEQEYFLVDEAFYYLRPDLVMTGRTLFGSLTAKNQQLSDHYFGTVPERILSFMQELDLELYRLGIPAKTRHNEVAPGQFEIAPIFTEGNLAVDHNQLVMALISKVASKHHLQALLHEKPFAGINGSGKHMNWSMATDKGDNLLSPGNGKEQNYRFLTLVAIITEAVYRHSDLLRLAVASHGNDHRLGGHEAPPSIISIYIGETLEKFYNSILHGTEFTPCEKQMLDVGASQLALLLKDNSDRNRTSPFAFTGNRFEFRAVGSSQAVGFPLTILNAAVSEVLQESNEFLREGLKAGGEINGLLVDLTKKWLSSSQKVIFNGDGYSEVWRKEAAQRGLYNLANTYQALMRLKEEEATNFLKKSGIMREGELKARYNVLLEKYNTHLEIECTTFLNMVNQQVIPCGIEYKKQLGSVIQSNIQFGVEGKAERALYEKITELLNGLHQGSLELAKRLGENGCTSEQRAERFSTQLLPLSSKMVGVCNQLEELLPESVWSLPTYYDMLFLR